MLSKAEILYLQGQKIVSMSYERKLKCLIRKKLDVLQKELPLLSKLFCDGVNSFMDFSTTTAELAAPSAKDKTSSNQPNQQLPPNNRATKFSNLESNDIETDADKDLKCQNFDESTLLDKENSTPATEFSNIRYNTPLATEFGSKNRLKKQNTSKKLPSGINCLQQVINGDIYHLEPNTGKFDVPEPKYYINNPSSLIETAVGSGGVEVINQNSHTVRLSISPSQGDDPGFKSRPEHPLFSKRRLI